MTAAVAVELRTKPTRRMAKLTDIAPDGPAGLNLDTLTLGAGEQYRFAFDMRACVGCHSCEVACAEQNGLPPEVAWRRVGELEAGDHPSTRKLFVSMACNHCVEPTCMQGCPTEAYIKLDSGIVQHLAEECIGCQYCTWNCPYSVPVFQPDRRIVTKCDLCKPRLDAGAEPACVASCPTKAITIEKVNIAEWVADHHEADGPGMPSSDITISTTRLILPDNAPLEAVAASDHRLAPEHPHWPLVWLTLLSQWATGTTLFATIHDYRFGAWIGAGLAGAALTGSLAHLGRPLHAYKAMRNLRRSWLSREALLLAVYAAAAGLHGLVGSPIVGYLAAALGLAGTYCSAKLYIVPGRPAWNSWLTVPSFVVPALALGSLTVGLLPVGAGLLAVQLVVRAANLVRLQLNARREWRGSAHLLVHVLRPWSVIRVVSTLTAIGLAVSGSGTAALIVGITGELVGRWLFYVSVVPMNMAGSFFREGR